MNIHSRRISMFWPIGMALGITSPIIALEVIGIQHFRGGQFISLTLIALGFGLLLSVVISEFERRWILDFDEEGFHFSGPFRDRTVSWRNLSIGRKGKPPLLRDEAGRAVRIHMYAFSAQERVQLRDKFRAELESDSHYLPKGFLSPIPLRVGLGTLTFLLCTKLCVLGFISNLILQYRGW